MIADRVSKGTQQPDDKPKKAEAMPWLTVMGDSQTNLVQEGAHDALRAHIKHLQPNQPALAALVLVRAFSLENFNLYIIGLRK